jgi:hypothetical protein
VEVTDSDKHSSLLEYEIKSFKGHVLVTNVLKPFFFIADAADK